MKPVSRQETRTLVAAAGRHQLVFVTREALRVLADLRWRRRRALALKVAGFSFTEIIGRLGVTYPNVNRHMTEARRGGECGWGHPNVAYGGHPSDRDLPRPHTCR